MEMINLLRETGEQSMVNPIHVVRTETNPKKYEFPTIVILDNGEKFFSHLEMGEFHCLWSRAMKDKTYVW
jgi:uncharacterized protein YlzI (FlbEa/FlbD family)